MIFHKGPAGCDSKLMSEETVSKTYSEAQCSAMTIGRTSFETPVLIDLLAAIEKLCYDNGHCTQDQKRALKKPLKINREYLQFLVDELRASQPQE